ncbi:MAG: sulfite exporter TauE/SafE family protein [Oscillospiraceae bacterium]
MHILFFAVSLIASIAGSICGIGGGVIIKPTLDLFAFTSVEVVSFLSGCTVLAMSGYSVITAVVKKEHRVNKTTSLPLALGGAVGGLLGKHLFTMVRLAFNNSNVVGGVQSVCLALITLGALMYTLKRAGIKTHRVKNFFACVIIGLVLGAMSGFLGIGGGPINLVVLYFFFSEDTKTAAQNSLYIILFSQLASLIASIATKTVPPFEWTSLVLMVLGGVLGGFIGRQINKKISARTVEKLFVFLMVVIIGFSIYNAIQYF